MFAHLLCPAMAFYLAVLCFCVNPSSPEFTVRRTQRRLRPPEFGPGLLVIIV